MNPYLIQGPALISFSGGRSSGKLLHAILDASGGQLPPDVHVAFANTGKEMPQSLDFVQECSTRWDVPITWLEFDPTAERKTRIVNHNSASRNGEPFSALLDGKRMLPNPLLRFCTIELKIRRMKEFCMREFGWSHWSSVVGFRADEPRRLAKLPVQNISKRDRWTTIAPMAIAGVTKADVLSFWRAQPFDLRLPVDDQGDTVLGNCDLCFLKKKSRMVAIVAANPDRADWWIRQEQRGVGVGRAALFRTDRPSYAEMLRLAERDRLDPPPTQPDMFAEVDDVDCACTD